MMGSAVNSSSKRTTCDLVEHFERGLVVEALAGSMIEGVDDPCKLLEQ